jgi:hypothetical protein
MVVEGLVEGLVFDRRVFEACVVGFALEEMVLELEGLVLAEQTVLMVVAEERMGLVADILAALCWARSLDLEKPARTDHIVFVCRL